MSQPGTVRTVREFEAHHVTILHRAPIISVLGVDLESDVRIGQPVISCHGTGDWLYVTKGVGRSGAMESVTTTIIVGPE